ncbi:unnamed protein product [Rhodiola kirilowii]
MAMSISSSTGCILMRDLGLAKPTLLATSSTTSLAKLLPKPPRRLFLIRSTGEVVSAEGVTKEQEFETDASPVETTKGRLPSLISAMNVEKALRGIAITDADHYGRLGLGRLCPYEEVTVAYKKKVEELMSSNDLEQEDLNKQLELLKESHSILSSIEERRLYDWSLARMDKPGMYSWPFEADITQIPTRVPPPKAPEDEGPTQLVAYFILTWVILSFVVSIVLNR